MTIAGHDPEVGPPLPIVKSDPVHLFHTSHAFEHLISAKERLSLVHRNEGKKTMNIDTAKSFATEANLDKHLKKVGLDQARPLKVRNTQGRWTAVFGYALSGVQNPPSIAHFGFPVIN